LNTATAIVLGLAGALAGVPVAAVAYSTPTTGRLQLPRRWWLGGPARPALIAVTAACTGAAATIIAAVLPPTLVLPSFWLFAVVGVGLAIIDVRCRRLPHSLTGILFVSSGLCFVAAAATDGGPEPLIRAIVSGTAATAILLVVALALPGQLGLGDVAFGGAVAFSLGWLSWHAAVAGVLGGLLIQGIVGLVARLRRTTDAMLPMGPALITGWLLAIAFVRSV
jgi:leader peptidase (prepilin peptidase)/N-methyltransferase